MLLCIYIQFLSINKEETMKKQIFLTAATLIIYFPAFAASNNNIKVCIEESKKCWRKFTPLHIACQKGYIEAAKYFIDQQHNVNAKNFFDSTPLHIAAYYGETKIIHHLIKNGSDINGKNYSGATPLHMACMNKKLESVKILVENGANPNAEGDCEVTPLSDAICSGCVLMVQYLIKNGAKIKPKNHHNMTPLPLAYAHNRSNKTDQLKMVRYLISNNLVEIDNKSLIIAKQLQKNNILEYLLLKKREFENCLST